MLLDIEARLEESNSIVLEREKCIEKKVNTIILSFYFIISFYYFNYYFILRKF